LNLRDITVLILTFNESANIARTLQGLAWATSVVLVDSHSTDDTLILAQGFPNVRCVQRHFDSHARQWSFGLRDTGIASEWVLALDADYGVTQAFVDEMAALAPPDDVAGYEARYIYHCSGRALQ
jgi:glycosyltransferase involved in cell wall biosynthesis